VSSERKERFPRETGRIERTGRVTGQLREKSKVPGKGTKPVREAYPKAKQTRTRKFVHVRTRGGDP